MNNERQLRKSGLQGVGNQVLHCPLCGEGLLPTTAYSLLGETICLKCLLHLGPERAEVLLKVRKVKQAEIVAVVNFLRELLTQNQMLRLREAIHLGGRNWWVKLPEFGEYICKVVKEQGCQWDSDVLDEIWDRLVEEAVEE
jgi:hypothetical protein